MQSSPWQRDHCWKQATPRKNVSSEMTMYYSRPRGSRLSPKCYKTARIRLRRPYLLATDVVVLEPKPSGIPVKRGINDASVKHEPVNLNVKEETTDDFIDVEHKINGSPDSVKQEPTDYIDVESNDGGTGDDGDEVDGTQHSKDVIPITASKLTNGSSKLQNRPKLNEILQKLNARVAETVTQRPMVVGASALVNHSGRIDLHNHQLQQHVSPRKRILRDMEKVSLDDHQSTMKRSRAKAGNNGHGHVLSPPTPTPTPSITTSNHTQHTSSAMSGCGATQQINFPSNSTLSNNNKVLNGIHNEGVSLPPPVTQATSRPISSYSITSLLSHNNNNNNSIKSETNTTKDVIDHQRTTHLCSPKSPPSFHPSTSKSSSAFSSNNKKKSPTYSGGSSSLSPIINHSQHNAANIQSHYNGGSSSLGSPVNYGRSRSPDLSPSPDQAYTRYRQAPYGLSQSQSSVSSPTSSAIFHPYLPTLSSRASPSGALSPPSAAAEAHRYRYGSPNHQQYVSGGGAAGSQQSSGSPYSRYSPSAYSQISPQHYSSKSTVNSNVYNLNSSTKGRDSSPNGGVPHRSNADPLRDPTTSSSYGGGSSNAASTRTVPKKTAALRQSYGSPVSSPSVIDSRNSENYYKSLATQSNEQLSRKYAGGGNESTNLSRSRSPTELQRHYEKEYRMHNSNASVLGAAAAGLSETDANSSSMIRPAQIPSLQHTPPSMYYMYHPQPAASAAVYYQSLAYAANAANVFRNPMWLQYPSVHPSRLGNPLLAYGGGMPTSHGNHPWGAISHPAMLAGEAASLLSIKEEPSSGKF